MYEIRIEGLNHTRLLNTLARDGVKVCRVNDGARCVMMAVSRKDLPKAVAILESMCYNYAVKGGFGEILTKLLARLPMIIALVLMTALVFSSNFFVWRIEVDGAAGAKLLDVLEIVSDCGVGVMSPKSRVDVGEIEAALRSGDGITSASVSVKGNVLMVYVLTEEGSHDHDTGGGDLVSGFDGVVTRIVTESGTPLVKAGDVVKRGDVLISGDVLSTADGTVIGRTEVKGSVFAEVSFGYSYPLASAESLSHTGNVYEATSLSLFGLTIGGGEPPFALYDRESTYEKLFPLPIEVTHTVYRELALTGAGNEIEKYITERSGKLNELFGKEFSSRYSVTNIGGMAVLKTYFTAEICIGEI